MDVPYHPQETDDTCAPACLRMALTFCPPHRSFPEARLSRLCGCNRLGSAADDVFCAARRCGLDARWLDDRSIETEVEDTLRTGWPLLAFVELSALSYWNLSDLAGWHAVLIIGLDDEYVYVHDPDSNHGGRRQPAARRAFFASWWWGGYTAFACQVLSGP